MSRPPFEVADIIRSAGNAFREQYGSSLTWPQHKVLDAIVRCRTAALGGHRDQCSSCGREAISYNSCRNRHCPKCQSDARDQWLVRRQQELLNVGYYHLVFSVPHELVPLMWQNKRQLFSLLFEASAGTLLDVAAGPKHLGAELVFFRFCTPGDKPSPHIRTSTAWFLEVASLQTIPGGSLRVLTSFSRSRCSAAFFAGSSSLDCDGFLPAASCGSLASAFLFLRRSTSAGSCASFIGQTGLCMPSRLSVAPSTCCTISLATRIVSPSPTTACFL
jgi:hypothetical protein